MKSFRDIYYDNPADLASLAAIQAANSEPEVGKSMLPDLDNLAELYNFTRRGFVVEATRALSILQVVDEDTPLPAKKYNKLLFAGVFTGYSNVTVAGFKPDHEVGALCMLFETATLAPNFEEIADMNFLHVPVLAVDIIEPSRQTLSE